MGILKTAPGHCPVKWTLLARLTLLLLSWLLVVSPVTAMDKSHRVKAAMIYQFAKYTQWPKAMGDTITFCTYGGDTLAGALYTIQNKRVRNMRVDVRQVSSLGDVLRYCQVVFIGSQHASLPTLLDGLENSAILTVGETKNFTHQGGMINFVRRGLKQKFEINQIASTKANLNISSKLLQIAVSPRS